VSREFCDELADLLDQQQFVICGDFNCPGTDGHQLHASLVDVLHQYDAVQHVVDATRGDNTLDLMVTTSDDDTILPQVRSPCTRRVTVTTGSSPVVCMCHATCRPSRATSTETCQRSTTTFAGRHCTSSTSQCLWTTIIFIVIIIII